MSLKICHISDTHTKHNLLTIPPVDVLIHTGDFSNIGSNADLIDFLIWFERQPAKKKIFIAGNHDRNMDRNWTERQKNKGYVEGLLANQYYIDAKNLLESYDVKYLNNTDYVFEGVKFYGSPYTPSFHREHWAFNADRGQEIMKQWSKIPNDVDVLLTHGPVYGILDECDDNNHPGKVNVGCKDLLNVIKKRLFKLKLHASGHIHDQVGVVLKPVSNTRRILFSNGAVVSNRGEQLVTKPLIIEI